MTLENQGPAVRVGMDPADTPLLSVLRDFEGQGYTGQFDSREGGLAHCFKCGAECPIESCSDGAIVRLEGASDPADMLAVVPVACPECGTRGVLVANYGPEGSADDDQALRALDRRPRWREDGA